MNEVKSVSEHYDAKYYSWQRNIGEFGGWANSHKFLKTIKPADVVIDFGCGGGFLLAQLNARNKIDIEPNEVARKEGILNGLMIFANSDEAAAQLGENFADVIISNHALEHVLNPLQELINLKRLLKPRGRIHFFVPCDSVDYLYDPADINYHLFSWSPQNLGNLFNCAGYDIIYVRPYKHKWMPMYWYIAKLGWPVFDFLSRVYGQMSRNWTQVEILALKTEL